MKRSYSLFYFSDQMFQKYQPKKPPMNPFKEEEEEMDDSNPFKDDMDKNVNNSAISNNPFEEEETNKSDTILDLLNPFNEVDDSPSPSSSLERPHKYKKKKAPPAPSNKVKAQTLPNQLQKKPDDEDKLSAINRLSLPLKSPKKKATTPERPIYEGTPPPSPEEKRRSRPITPPSTEPDTDSSMASTPSSV